MLQLHGRRLDLYPLDQLNSRRTSGSPGGGAGGPEIRHPPAVCAPDQRQTRAPVGARRRQLWDLGRRTAAGDPNLVMARAWVESEPSMSPGTNGSVRLAPRSPTRWSHLQPGMTITMHEGRPAVGTATIIEASHAR